MSMSNVLFLLLPFCCGWVYSAPDMAQSLHLNVGYGETVVLPCRGSPFMGEDISVQWEAMGSDVAALQGDTVTIQDRFQGRVSFASEEQRALGDWSIVVNEVKFSDTDMYECIWRGRRTLSTVWLTVLLPQIDPVLEVYLNETAMLPCYLDISKHVSLKNLNVWWERDGEIVFARIDHAFTVSESYLIDPQDNHDYLSSYNIDKFPLHLDVISYNLSGDYNCWYQAKDSDDPKPGIPGTIKLIVYERYNDTETTTEEWGSASFWTAFPLLEFSEETTETTTTDTIPVLLDQVTSPMEVVTEPLPMEAFDETVTSFPDNGSLDDPEPSYWTDFPWVRTGIIGGVLLVTAVVLCILGALHKL